MRKRLSLSHLDFVYLKPSICGGMMLLAGFGLSLNMPHVKAEPAPAIQESPGADPKLDELTFFENNWECVSKLGTDNEQPHSPPFEWSMMRELNDLWFFAQSEQKPAGTFAVETFGYNTILGKFGRTVVGNDGTFANFLSDGWVEDEWVWMGSSSNMLQKTTGKHQVVVTKTSDRSFTEVEQSSTEEGQWTTVSTKYCVLAETPAQ